MMDGLGMGLGLGFMILYLFFIGVSIYMIVLFIKLARRGIKALDIYIENNPKDKQI